MLRLHPIRRAVRYALAFATAATFISPTLNAQQRTDQTAEEPEEIVVVFYEKLETVLSVLGEFGATPTASLPPLVYPPQLRMAAEAGRTKFGA